MWLEESPWTKGILALTFITLQDVGVLASIDDTGLVECVFSHLMFRPFLQRLRV